MIACDSPSRETWAARVSIKWESTAPSSLITSPSNLSNKMAVFFFLIHFFEVGRQGMITPVLRIRTWRLRSLAKPDSGSPV